MIKNIIVDWDNCPEVAAQVVEALRGKVFKVEGYIALISPQPTIKMLPNLRLYDGPPVSGGIDPKVGYRFDNGVVTIPVSPGWVIRWNLKSETTMVSFMDNGKIIIEKKRNRSSTSYTLIITITGSSTMKGEPIG